MFGNDIHQFSAAGAFGNAIHQWSVKQCSSLQFNLVQSLDRLGLRGDMRDDSAEILFKSFLQEHL